MTDTTTTTIATYCVVPRIHEIHGLQGYEIINTEISLRLGGLYSLYETAMDKCQELNTKAA